MTRLGLLRATVDRWGGRAMDVLARARRGLLLGEDRLLGALVALRALALLLGSGLGRVGGLRRSGGKRQRRVALAVEIGDHVRPVLGLGEAGEGHFRARGEVARRF